MDTEIDHPIPYAPTDALTLLERWQSAGDRECRIVCRDLLFHVHLTQLANGRPIVIYSQWGEGLEETVLAALRLAMGTEEA